MNILTIGYLHGAGGAERQIILLSNQLAQRCHQVTLCVLAENRSNFSISEHVNLIDCTDEKGPGFFRIIHRWKCLRKNIREIRPDVIVNYNLQSAYLCLTLSKEVRGKVVYSERGDPYDSEYSGLLKIIRDYTVAHMDGLVFQSEGARDYFPEKIWNKGIPHSCGRRLLLPQPELRQSPGRVHLLQPAGLPGRLPGQGKSHRGADKAGNSIHQAALQGRALPFILPGLLQHL